MYNAYAEDSDSDRERERKSEETPSSRKFKRKKATRGQVYVWDAYIEFAICSLWVNKMTQTLDIVDTEANIKGMDTEPPPPPPPIQIATRNAYVP